MGLYLSLLPCNPSAVNDWFKIEARNGQVISLALCHLQDHRLVGCRWDSGISLVPRGTFLLLSDLRSFGWDGPEWDNDDVFLNIDDLSGIERTGKWCGCCGPCGDYPNLESSEGLPMAYERADCYQNASVRIPKDWHRRLLVGEMSAKPVILMGVGKINGKDEIFERACGPDLQTATIRLKESAEKLVREWIKDEETANIALTEMRLAIPDDIPSLLKTLQGEYDD